MALNDKENRPLPGSRHQRRLHLGAKERSGRGSCGVPISAAAASPIFKKKKWSSQPHPYLFLLTRQGGLEWGRRDGYVVRVAESGVGTALYAFEVSARSKSSVCVYFYPWFHNQECGESSVIKVANKTTQLSGSTGYAAAALNAHIYRPI